jgi:hypothetical protein
MPESEEKLKLVSELEGHHRPAAGSVGTLGSRGTGGSRKTTAGGSARSDITGAASTR